MESISSQIRNYFSPDARYERQDAKLARIRARHIEADPILLNEFLPEEGTRQIMGVKNVVADIASRNDAKVSFFNPANEYGEERKPYVGGDFIPKSESFPSNEVGVRIIQSGKNREITCFVPCEANGEKVETFGKRVATEVMHSLADKEETIEDHIANHAERRAAYMNFSRKIGSEKALELYKKTLMDMAKTIR